MCNYYYYKIITQKCNPFLYTNNEDQKDKETIPFAIVSKRIKHLEIKLPKETKNLYSETI